MKVTDFFKPDKPTLSFEFFPPKTEEQEKNLFEVIGQLCKFNPDFASVTYGAMGTTREKTFFWAAEIKKKYQLEPVAHLTCIAATPDSIRQQLEELSSLGVENILALRGDPPADFAPPAEGFSYAKDLISFIKQNKPNICLGAAGFPESTAPLDYLKKKIDAGAEFVITQLFFDNRFYFEFVERCRRAGIKVPIVAGIMPITSLKQIKRMTEVCCASLPDKLLKDLETTDDAVAVGIEQAVNQCQQLLAAKVAGLHFFVMNQSGPISQILTRLKS